MWTFSSINETKTAVVLWCSVVFVFQAVTSASAGAPVDPLTCGKACMSKGAYKKAALDFQTAVKKSPKSCEGHLLLGQVYCKLKQYRDGRDQLRLAMRYGHGSKNAQQANIALMKLPEQLIAPKTGPETGKLVTTLALPAAKNGAMKPTVIDFYATWCNPCQQLHATLEKAKSEYGDRINFLRVDVDDEKNQKVIEQYEVSPIPTVVYLNSQGEVVTFSIGFSGETSINENLKKIVGESDG